MLKGFKYRIYPTKSQSELINKHIDGCRLVYNLALEVKQAAYASNRISLTCFDLFLQLPDLKKQCGWLKEINAQSLQQAIANLDAAFNKFYKGKAKFPRFKKKTSKQSYGIPGRVRIEGGKLFIPKFREGININMHREITGIIKIATITKTSTGKYLASVVTDDKIEFPAKGIVKEKTSIGVDLGIKSFLVTSYGQIFDNPNFLKKKLAKLKYLKRKHSIYKGKKSKHNAAALHEKVANQRRDFLHKLSSKLISDNQTICIEDLNICGLLKNHKIARAISDAGWGEFVFMLEYKAQWYGKNILRIGRFDPSSKICSNCGSTNKELRLEDREWTCSKCGTVLDRDINAAINIKNFALKNYVSGTETKTRNELPTLVGVMTSETIAL